MTPAIPAITAFITSTKVVTAMIVGAVGGLAAGGGLKGALKGALFGAVTGGISAGIQGLAGAASGAAAGAGSTLASGAANAATTAAGQIVQGMGSDQQAPEPSGWSLSSAMGDESIDLAGGKSPGDGIGLQDTTQSNAAAPIQNPDINMRLDGAAPQSEARPVREVVVPEQQAPPPSEAPQQQGGTGILGSVAGATSQVGRWARENPDAAKILGGGLSAVMQQRAADSRAQQQRRWQVEDRERLENNARWVYTGAR